MDDDCINGNRYIPFTELMRLDNIGEGTFRSTAKAYATGSGTSAYGGHVYAQAVWAAAQTVIGEFVIHNVSGWFTLPGNTRLPFVYTVRKIRDGGRYCTRTVDVVQEPQKGICFTCTCSFKRDEPVSVDCQETLNLREKYRAALKDKEPHEWPEAPGIDAPWYWEHSAASGNFIDPFPGLSLRKVDMTEYNVPLNPFDRRQLQYYSAIGPMPPVSEQPNLHACAHLYASDRNGLFVITNHLDMGNDFTHMASLSHTVVIHVGAEDLSMGEKTEDNGGSKRWFCQEAWMTRAAGGRGLHESRLWSDSGVHIASTLQDGLVKMDEGKMAHKFLGEHGRQFKGML